jgi:hypothetical protein
MRLPSGAAARHHVAATLAVGDRERGDVARGIDDADMGRAPAAGRVARDLGLVARQQFRIEQALGGGLFLGLGGGLVQA